MNKNKKQDEPNQNRGGKSNPEQQQRGPVSGSGNPSERGQSAPDQQLPDRSQEPQNQSEQNSAGEWQRPVTNQDAQRKTTNAQGADQPMGEEETEGEPGQERIKPYKNIGDDSEEVEKKTPSM